MNPGKAIQNKINGVKQNFADYKKLDSRDKKTYWKEFLLNNALYILLIVAIIYTYIQNSNFLSAASIVNIISLSAANLPIACGIAGCIVLTGTDLSAGRVVGLTACITASLMQSDLCHQDVPEPSGTSDPSGDPDRTVGRWYRGMGQRFLRSEIPVASLHRNSGYPVDRIRPTVNVHHDQRQ